MIARRRRYDVADVSPAFGQFVVNRYIGQSLWFHSFNSFNPLSLFAHSPFRKVEPVKCIEQGVNEVYLVRRLGATLHDTAQV